MKLSVQVPTYNRPRALDAVLQGYLRQSDLDFELIVADDGSGDETRQVVQRFQASAPFPVRHVWHSDEGFRLAGIRNRAIAATSAEYLLLTDGDCIPLRHHVARHKALAEPGWFVAGSRVYLDHSLTNEIEHGITHPGLWEPLDWLRFRARGRVTRLGPLMTLPARSRWRRWQPGRWERIKTANLGVWRPDLLAVNGFDESFEGWGLEDTDLLLRLTRHGLNHKSGRYAVPVLHLWHPEVSRTGEAGNRERLEELMSSDRMRARRGLAETAAD